MRIISFLLFGLVFLTFSCTENSSVDEKETEKANIAIEEKDSLSGSEFSLITCPDCGFSKTEKLPTEVCLLKYTCEKCKKEMFPAEEDCCVFCTYGDKKCPSMQE
jgi:hypothetical protein